MRCRYEAWIGGVDMRCGYLCRCRYAPVLETAGPGHQGEVEVRIDDKKSGELCIY